MRHIFGGALIAIPCASLVLLGACTSLTSEGPLGSSYFSHTYLTVILGGHDLKLTEHATGFTPEVLVSGQSGATLGTSTVDASGTNALLDYSPAADAALLLWVGSSDQRAFGPYTLTIN